MRLSFGFAVHSDFDGAAFTLQSFFLYHREVAKDAEVIVVDNAPDTRAGRRTADLVAAHQGRYVPFRDYEGTSGPRDLVFREATGDVVVCVDAHVLLAPGALIALIRYFEQHPDSCDLVSGPMLDDRLQVMWTHWDDDWRAEMWGTGGRAWHCRCGAHLAACERGDGVAFRTLVRQQPVEHCQACGAELPVIAWAGHEHPLQRWGLQALAQDPTEPAFEIPAMGLGVFACRREAWLGFNPRFRGFGGEEWYLHEKYRRAGARCLCLPALRWWHRFNDPGQPTPYPLQTWWKIRNYVLGHQELGLPLDRLREHFKGTHPWHFDMAAQGLEWPTDAAEAPLSWCKAPEWHAVQAALRRRQQARAASSSGATPPEGEQPPAASPRVPGTIDEHLPRLRELAQQSACVAVVLPPQAGPLALEIAPPGTLLCLHDGDPPAGCDLLILDVLGRSADDVYAALFRHAPLCRGRMALYGSVASGKNRRAATATVAGVRRYLRENPAWSVMGHDRGANGLLTLTRRAEDKKPLPPGWQQAWTFLKATARQAAAGWGNAREETMEARLAVCTLCPSRNGDRCGDCGCGLQKKTSWPKEFCPLGLWHAEEPAEPPAADAPAHAAAPTTAV